MTRSLEGDSSVGERGDIRRVYLAGPMRGLPEYNFPAFHAAARALRNAGLIVWSPAERDEAEGFDPQTDEAKPLKYYMQFDLAAVCAADAVVVLPDWEQSQGARLEVYVARECGMPVLWADTLEPVTQGTILDEASRITASDRQAVYGHPADDFARTAAFWTTRFAHKLRPGEVFTADEVPAAMRLVKESRLVQSTRHRDSLVDIAGYARTQEMIWERELLT